MLTIEQKKQFEQKIPFVFDIQSRHGNQGTLSYWEKNEVFPLGIQRCFWVHDVDEGVTRGNHAHKSENQVVVAISGTLEIIVTDSSGKQSAFILDDPKKALYLPPMHWIETRFKPGSVLLGLCNEPFSEENYIRDFQAFKATVK